MAEQTEVRFDTNAANTQTQEPAKPAEPSKPERPAWLPEKFKSPEDLVRSYTELEKRQSTAKPTKDADGDAIDYAGLTEEFTKGGRLSDDTIKALEKRGIPREMVESHVEGLRALADRRRSELAEVVGGTETLDETLKWASRHLDDSEIDGYNALLSAGNIAAAKVLLKDFAQRFQDANGKDGTSATDGAGNGKAGGVTGYASAAEMIADMRKPEYQNDPAFREKVRAKVALASF